MPEVESVGREEEDDVISKCDDHAIHPPLPKQSAPTTMPTTRKRAATSKASKPAAKKSGKKTAESAAGRGEGREAELTGGEGSTSQGEQLFRGLAPLGDESWLESMQEGNERGDVDVDLAVWPAQEGRVVSETGGDQSVVEQGGNEGDVGMAVEDNGAANRDEGGQKGAAERRSAPAQEGQDTQLGQDSPLTSNESSCERAAQPGTIMARASSTQTVDVVEEMRQSKSVPLSRPKRVMRKECRHLPILSRARGCRFECDSEKNRCVGGSDRRAGKAAARREQTDLGANRQRRSQGQSTGCHDRPVCRGADDNRGWRPSILTWKREWLHAAIVVASANPISGRSR